MTPIRFAADTADGHSFYGAVTDEGTIALNDTFREWPTLIDAMAAQSIGLLIAAAREQPVSHSHSHSHSDYVFDMAIPNAPHGAVRSIHSSGPSHFIRLFHTSY